MAYSTTLAARGHFHVINAWTDVWESAPDWQLGPSRENWFDTSWSDKTMHSDIHDASKAHIPMRRAERDLLPVAPAWMNDGACIARPEVKFFREKGGRDGYRSAVAICGGCVVRRTCAAYAIENEIPEGVWGGLTPEDRKPLKFDRSDAVIYFAADLDGRVKIGTTLNLEQRLKELQFVYRTTVTLLATEPGYFRREGELLKKFAHLRDGGPRSEWFTPGSDLLAYIDTLNGVRAIEAA